MHTVVLWRMIKFSGILLNKIHLKTSQGSTGNFIVDFYYGREFNPSMGGFDVKLVAFRASMIALALVNVLLVLDSVNASRGVVNGAVMATAAFQVSVYFFPWEDSCMTSALGLGSFH